MPQLTEKENELLKMLGAPSVPVLGKARMKEVAGLVHRLMFLADEAAHDKRLAELRYSFVIGAVHGLLTKEDILAKGLPPELETEALLLRQQYDDAQAFQKQNKLAVALDTSDIGEVKPHYWYRELKHTGIDAGTALCLLRVGDKTVQGQGTVTGPDGEDFQNPRQVALQIAILTAKRDGLITDELAGHIQNKYGGYHG